VVVGAALPYCGLPPVPGTLISRFNLDPVLIGALLALGAVHLRLTARALRPVAAAGWLVTAAALLSPLCALSVALFAARIAQHMVLVLCAAPLLALSLPAPPHRGGRLRLWGAALAFLLALWFWHMPRPYDATFSSTLAYWAMHVTVFGSALGLWRELLHGGAELSLDAMAAGTASSMQMGLLGAVLTCAQHPLFFAHLTSTQAWGLAPLMDQQLGGVLMWVPGIALFLWVALRALDRLRRTLDAPPAT